MKTIYQQTGWKRQHPRMICQDYDAIFKVTEFCYDIKDSGFLGYIKSRGLATCGDDPKFINDPDILQINKAKLQDCWELYQRELGNLEEEVYIDDVDKKTNPVRILAPEEKADKLKNLLNSIYS